MMKNLIGILTLSVLIFTGCIGTDIEESIPQSLRIIQESDITFRATGTYPLTAEFKDEAGITQQKDLIWTSSDISILEIINNNSAKAKKEGVAILTVTAGELSDSSEVIVEGSKEVITITSFVEMLGVDQSFTLSINYQNIDGNVTTTTPIWESSNAAILTVSETGVITGQSAGIAEITVSTGSVSDVISVSVLSDPVTVDPVVRITVFDNTLKPGETFMFEGNYFDDSAMADNSVALTWSSSDESIISIDNNGLATANAPGNAQITASAKGLMASQSITVEADNVTERTGNLRGTGYTISGSFKLSEDGNGDLILSFENSSIDRNAPGPYFYLSNQERNVNGGINLGKTKDGDFSINISNEYPDVTLTSFDHVVVWCEPFNIRLGIGSFEN